MHWGQSETVAEEEFVCTYQTFILKYPLMSLFLEQGVSFVGIHEV
ncbi:hypothetical protein [Halobacillus shinanisalinarum]|nr:hypothetical protein [Halobacillus shinanisalinarum]